SRSSAARRRARSRHKDETVAKVAEDIMSRSILFLLSLAVALCNPFSANAQGEKRITILYDAFGPPSSLKMDWGDGRNVAIEYRWGEGRPSALPSSKLHRTSRPPSTIRTEPVTYDASSEASQRIG